MPIGAASQSSESQGLVPGFRAELVAVKRTSRNPASAKNMTTLYVKKSMVPWPLRPDSFLILLLSPKRFLGVLLLAVGLPGSALATPIVGDMPLDPYPHGSNPHSVSLTSSVDFDFITDLNGPGFQYDGTTHELTVLNTANADNVKHVWLY